MLRWIWIGGWGLLVIGGSIQALVDPEVDGLPQLFLLLGVAIYSVTFYRWYNREVGLVELWKGSYTGFSVSYIVCALAPWSWQIISAVGLVVMVYFMFLENDRFLTWLAAHDQPSHS